MRNRPIPNLQRRGSVREPVKYFYLYCEGGRTEPEYFSALQHFLASVRIKIEIEPAAGVPCTLAERAVCRAKQLGISSRRKATNSFEERDEVWIVCDRDEHPKYEEAIGQCKSGGVRVARSNPCFEVWLILHIRDYDKPDDRHNVQNDLRKLCPEYTQKNKVPNCAELIRCIEKAESRARILLERRESEGQPFGRPSTTVGNLTEAIRSAAKKSSPR